jgi:hypothetical protein
MLNEVHCNMGGSQTSIIIGDTTPTHDKVYLIQLYKISYQHQVNGFP